MSSRNGRARGVASFVESLEPRQLLTAAVSSTDILAQVSSKNGIDLVTNWVRKHPTAFLSNSISLKHSKQLFNTSKHATLQIRVKPGSNMESVIKAMSKVAGARWASPNYLYGKAKTELTPNDPRLTSQIDHLNRIQALQAWDTTIGNGVVVAVLDDGVSITHEDLVTNIWTNTGEIAGNGIDDDNNGYIDDVHGWDFGSNDNDPTPVLDQQYNFVNSHGTLVAGIIGASINNNIGIAGVAGGVKIMPVRFTGYGVNVSSAGIAQSLAYAAMNGAKIINVSFSIDPYMNDPALAAATDLVHANGAIWINSAGNATVANPPRLVIEKALFVSNTTNADVLFSNSNWGDGIDVSAPGTNTNSTTPGNQYQRATGTSFSTAMTSGTAALIWSAHPTWTRDQVVAQLVGSVDNIDAQNPTLIGQLGSGRINAYKAVTSTIAAPTIRGLKGIASGSTVTTKPTTLTLKLKSVLDGTKVNGSNFQLIYAGSDGVFNGNDTIIPLTLNTSYFYGTNELKFTLPSGLSSGNFKFVAKSTLADPFGQALDGNADGVGGDDFQTLFTVNPLAPNAPTNLTAELPDYSPNEAVLRWTDNSGDETGFIIQRSSTPNFSVITKTINAAADTTRFNDWGLVLGQTYYYRIQAVNDVGPSAFSPSVTLALPLPPPGIPATPATFTAITPSYSFSEVELVWTDSSNNETEFVIERSSTAAFSTIERTITALPNSNRYNDWGLQIGQDYFYRIKAVNVADNSDWVTIPYTPPAATTVPEAPGAIVASAVPWSTTELELKWADNAINESFYTIQRSLTPDFADATNIAASPANTTGQYNVWGLANATTYYFRIRAGNPIGVSAWSVTTSFTTPT